MAKEIRKLRNWTAALARFARAQLAFDTAPIPNADLGMLFPEEHARAADRRREALRDLGEAKAAVAKILDEMGQEIPHDSYGKGK